MHPGSLKAEGLLAGMTSVSQTLLGMNIVPGGIPQPEDMEKAREAVLFNKTVKLKNFHVEVYNLMDASERTAYEDRIKELYEETQLRKIQITTHDRRFVEMPKPAWLVMLQWFEVELDIKANPAIVPPKPPESVKPSEAPAGEQNGKDVVGL